MDVLKTSFLNIITTQNINGKECYRIENYFNDVGNSTIFYDKETGLTLMVDDKYTREAYNGPIEYKYDFNNVDDSVFEEPDINLYEIKENIIF